MSDTTIKYAVFFNDNDQPDLVYDSKKDLLNDFPENDQSGIYQACEIIFDEFWEKAEEIIEVLFSSYERKENFIKALNNKDLIEFAEGSLDEEEVVICTLEIAKRMNLHPPVDYAWGWMESDRYSTTEKRSELERIIDDFKIEN